MELNRLEKYKKQFKELAPKINSMQSYLEKAGKTAKGIVFVTPYEVSAATGVDELAALFILSLAEKEHLVSKRYVVFSDNDTFIGEYSAKSKIPKNIPDPETGKDIDSEHYYIEISFEIPK